MSVGSSCIYIPCLSLRYPSVVVTVLQGYCKGIAKVLYKPVTNKEYPYTKSYTKGVQKNWHGICQ